MNHKNLLDGTPDAGKLSRPVWGKGKAGDHIKCIPIATNNRWLFGGTSYW